MLLTIKTTHRPATDLGHLLRKNPARAQTFDLTFGRAHVFYPEASDEECSVALLLEVDAIGLVKNRRGPRGEGRTLEQYVNDRPYVASSFLSVAIAEVFGSALAGKSKDRPEMVELPLPLSVTLAVLPCRGGEDFVRTLFEPLGYRVEVTSYPLDEEFPEWGTSPYFTVQLDGLIPLRVLLSHLYVLVPVLDNEKHYWVGDDEVEKLMRHGGEWLGGHPAREAITRRYLKYRRNLVEEALEQLIAEEEPVVEASDRSRGEAEARLEESMTLNEQRIGAVIAVLKASGARRVLDLGCGEGRLIRALLKEKAIEEILGMDVSHRALEIARDRLRMDQLAPPQRDRIRLIHGSLIYRDTRLEGYDAASVIEVIEHLDMARLAAFERVLFECARPRTIVITTPNAEFNVKWEALPAGQFRHNDHRFEWTRAEFRQWAEKVCERFRYGTRYLPIGPEDAQLGPPTQMAVFTALP